MRLALFAVSALIPFILTLSATVSPSPAEAREMSRICHVYISRFEGRDCVSREERPVNSPCTCYDGQNRPLAGRIVRDEFRDFYRGDRR